MEITSVEKREYYIVEATHTVSRTYRRDVNGDENSWEINVCGDWSEFVHYAYELEEAFQKYLKSEKELDNHINNSEELEIMRKSFTYFVEKMFPNITLVDNYWELMKILSNFHTIECEATEDERVIFTAMNAVWRLFRYSKVDDKIEDYKHKSGLIATISYDYGLRVINTIKDLIRSSKPLEKFLTDSKTKWNVDKIETKNGASLIFRSSGQALCGVHVGWLIIDDFAGCNNTFGVVDKLLFNKWVNVDVISTTVSGGCVLKINTLDK